MTKKLLIGASVLVAVAGLAVAASQGFTRSSGIPKMTKAEAAASLPPVSLKAPARIASAEAVKIVDDFPKNSGSVVTIVDADGDGGSDNYNKWCLYSWGSFDRYAMRIYGNSYATDNKNLNDWFFVPVQLPEDGKLTVAFSWYANSNDSHTFSVHYGSAPEVASMGPSLGTYDAAARNTPTDEELTVAGAKAGVQYIGFHATYPPVNGWLHIYGLNVWHEVSAAVEPGAEIFYMRPTEEEFNSAVIVDGNSDGRKIEYRPNAENDRFDWPIFYESDKSKDADEWFIAGPIDLSANENLYQVKIDGKIGATGGSEAFEISLGSAPTVEAMTKVILSEPSISNTDFVTYSSTFGLGTSGSYYVGIHIKSPKTNSWRLSLRDLRINYTGNSALVPGEVVNLTAYGATDGSLKAIAEFDMPVTAVNGQSLSGDVTAEVSIGMEMVSATGAPGSHQRVEVEGAQGLNIVSVLTRNANGEGLTSKTIARCGIDCPAAPVVKARESADNLSVTLTWNPVTEGASGGVVVPEDITYNVYEYVTEETSETVSQYFALVASDLKTTTYTFTPADTRQQSHMLLVTAKNSADETDVTEESLVITRLGQLYKLPMTEDYSQSKIELGGYVIESPVNEDYEASWGFASAANMEAAAGNVGTMACISQRMYAVKGQMGFPKFAIDGTRDLQVSMRVWMGNVTPNTVVKYVAEQDTVILGTFGPTSANMWQTLTYLVPNELSTKAWGSLVVYTELPTFEQVLMINAFNIGKLNQNNISISNATVGTCRQGEPTTFSFNVTNTGVNPKRFDNITAGVYRGIYKVADIELEYPAQQFNTQESHQFNGNFVVSASDFVGSDITLKVTYNGKDDYDGDNSASVSFRLNPTSKPVVNDLRLAPGNGGNGVMLEWSNPISDTKLESFETMLHGERGGKLDDWTNIDFDRKNVWTLEGYEMPGGVDPHAFVVVDVDEIAGAGLTTKSGSRMLMAFSAQEALSDDWLISPEIDASAGFSFWTSILSTAYAETIEVLVSTTDNDLDSFEHLETYTLSTWGWQKHDVPVPANAKYVALHYCSNDQFGVCIDDIAFKYANAPYELKGYSVYRNGERIDRSSTESYTDNHETFDTSVYNVAVIAAEPGSAEKEYALSNSVSLLAGGVEAVSGVDTRVYGGTGRIIFDGFAVAVDAAVYTVKGERIALLKGEGSFYAELPAGMYVVTVQDKTYKVVVR